MNETKFMLAVRFALLAFLIVGFLFPPLMRARVNRATIQVGAISGIVVLVGALFVNYFFPH